MDVLMTRIIFADEYLRVTPHGSSDEAVCVQVGDPPEEATPTVVSGRSLRDGLSRYLAKEEDTDA